MRGFGSSRRLSGGRVGRALQRGFTLIEMAIVMVVIGLLLSGGLLAVAPVLQSSKVSDTTAHLDRIEQALALYVIQYGCLPCPADGTLASTSANAGWSKSDAGFYGPGDVSATNQPCASPTGTACSLTQGVVPWKTLGMSEPDGADAWDDRITYAVTSPLTLTLNTSMVRTPPSTYPAGALTVNNVAGTTQTTAAAYVLVSHGPDLQFAYAVSTGRNRGNNLYGQVAGAQYQNSDTVQNDAFVQDNLVNVQGNTHFDDMVRWKTAPAIIQSCGTGACGNPS
jgi:prepilin-type N-terminal cleavage/methylation domain-containing protein